MNPTGNYRFRARQRLLRRPLLVLQIEEAQREFCQYRGDFITIRTWRDAAPEDVMNSASPVVFEPRMEAAHA